MVDLDAAMRQGSNKELLAKLTKRLTCQVGGGAATVEIAKEMLAAGAKRVVVGSALVVNEKIDTAFAKRLADQIGPEMPSAPIISPVKLYTGTATQRTSGLNSPSSMAIALPSN